MDIEEVYWDCCKSSCHFVYIVSEDDIVAFEYNKGDGPVCRTCDTRECECEGIVNCIYFASSYDEVREIVKERYGVNLLQFERI